MFLTVVPGFHVPSMWPSLEPVVPFGSPPSKASFVAKKNQPSLLGKAIARHGHEPLFSGEMRSHLARALQSVMTY